MQVKMIFLNVKSPRLSSIVNAFLRNHPNKIRWNCVTLTMRGILLASKCIPSWSFSSDDQSKNIEREVGNFISVFNWYVDSHFSYSVPLLFGLHFDAITHATNSRIIVQATTITRMEIKRTRYSGQIESHLVVGCETKTCGCCSA